MTSKDIQDYLDKGMYGAHQIKPDEQNKYLGTFRERVVFVVLFKEAETNIYDDFCLNKFADYRDGTLLINADCPTAVQNHFIHLAQKKSISFRIVDTKNQKLKPDDIAIVFSAMSALNLEDISVKNLPLSATTRNPLPVEKTTKQTNFLKRLFKL